MCPLLLCVSPPSSSIQKYTVPSLGILMVYSPNVDTAYSKAILGELNCHQLLGPKYEDSFVNGLFIYTFHVHKFLFNQADQPPPVGRIFQIPFGR